MHEGSMGHVTALDIEQMTIAQVFAHYAPAETLGIGRRRVSASEAGSLGLIDTNAKTGVQMALEQLAAQAAAKEQQSHESRRERRRRKREAATSHPVTSDIDAAAQN